MNFIKLIFSILLVGVAVAAPPKVDWKPMMTIAERKRAAQGNLLPLQSYEETIRRGMATSAPLAFLHWQPCCW